MSEQLKPEQPSAYDAPLPPHALDRPAPSAPQPRPAERQLTIQPEPDAGWRDEPVYKEQHWAAPPSAEQQAAQQRLADRTQELMVVLAIVTVIMLSNLVVSYSIQLIWFTLLIPMFIGFVVVFRYSTARRQAGKHARWPFPPPSAESVEVNRRLGSTQTVLLVAGLIAWNTLFRITDNWLWAAVGAGLLVVGVVSNYRIRAQVRREMRGKQQERNVNQDLVFF